MEPTEVSLAWEPLPRHRYPHLISLVPQGHHEGGREGKGVGPGQRNHLPSVQTEDSGPENHLQVRELLIVFLSVFFLVFEPRQKVLLP
jgi:hypothetical protein